MRTLRIDLTNYRPYIQALQDKLNEDGLFTMSMTDAVKIHKTVIDNCHIEVVETGETRKGEKEYTSSVSYDVFNEQGDHMASPTWPNIGNEDDTKSFIINEVRHSKE
ncbi:MAG TPA: hypothetical protein VJ987_05340 [Anaerolineales bacterium]|nr:hypothetical protein [Anaerolineales bacterium]